MIRAIAALLLSAGCLEAQATAIQMLRMAAVKGDVQTLESLLSSGLDADPSEGVAQAPLAVAIRADQLQAVQTLLRYRANPNAFMFPAEKFSETLLQYAAEHGNTQIVSMLINAGSRLNETLRIGRTPLHLALQGGHLDTAALLIEKGGDVNARDSEGASPLDDAVWRGSLNQVAILLAQGARLNEPDRLTGATPINEAAWRGNIPVVRYLLQFHPDLKTQDKQGRIPLENAIRNGKEDAALLLLDAEAKETLTPEFLGKAMDAAIRKDESALLEALLRHGIAANVRLPSGYTPLDAAAFGGAVKATRVLLDSGADPNIAGRDGTTPLADASMMGFESIASTLLDHGALLDSSAVGSGTTALYAAASFGKIEVVRLLLRRGANPNFCGANHKSPYQAALESGYTDVASELKAHGGAKGCH